MQRNHDLRIKKEYFELIDSGKKPLEVRVGYRQITRISVGDTITFSDYSPKAFNVKRVTRYEDFAEMLDTEDSQKIIPGVTKYKAHAMLQSIYPEDKEALGVYVFELSKDDEIKILSASSLVNKNHNDFGNLISKAYAVIDFICKDYPKHFTWYWEKTIPAVLKGTREVLVCTLNKKIAGVAFLKNEDGEQKVCTFLVLEEFRGKHIASKLLEKSFDFLGTTKPLISIADYKLGMFEGVIKKYGWEQTQILDEGYYNNTSREIVFNGKIS